MSQPYRFYAPIFFADPRDTLGGLRKKIPGGMTEAMLANEATWEADWEVAARWFDRSDDDMQRDFGDIADGDWSPAVAQIRQTHGIKAGRILVSRLYVSTPQDWTCPCCGRTKGEVVVPSKKNTDNWTARLVFHHDHGPEHGRQGRFEKTLLCEPCNTMEAGIKSSLGLPKWASFTPDEIHQFIVVAANQPHEKKPGVARRLYEARPAPAACPVREHVNDGDDEADLIARVKARIRELRPELAEYEVDLHYVAFMLRSTGDHLWQHGWVKTARYQMRLETAIAFHGAARPKPIESRPMFASRPIPAALHRSIPVPSMPAQPAKTGLFASRRFTRPAFTSEAVQE